MKSCNASRSVQLCSLTSVFLESLSARTLPGGDLYLISSWLQRTDSLNLVKQFNCLDSNEEMTKQYMFDQLLTRWNNLLSYVLFQLCINWVFLVFFLFQYQRQRHNFWGSFIWSFRCYTLPPWLICRLTDIASWQLRFVVNFLRQMVLNNEVERKLRLCRNCRWF